MAVATIFKVDGHEIRISQHVRSLTELEVSGSYVQHEGTEYQLVCLPIFIKDQLLAGQKVVAAHKNDSDEMRSWLAMPVPICFFDAKEGEELHLHFLNRLDLVCLDTLDDYAETMPESEFIDKYTIHSLHINIRTGVLK